MGKKKRNFFEGLFYNNKFLMILSLVVAIALWATVKINYSEEIVRSIGDIQISVNNTDSQGEYEMFTDPNSLVASVEVSGKGYNLNQYALTKDDIVVEATSSYVDSAGYKVLTLSAKVADTVSGVKVTKITPSSITVYYDRKTTGTFNVEAKLENDMDSIVDGELTVGQPVASMNTVDITGPASILNKLTKVYFTGKINEEDLPLSKTKELPAEISYQLDRESESKYLICESINEESNPATITVPVYVTRKVDTAVKFVNQPASFVDSVPNVTVYPSSATVLQNSKDDEIIETLYVGTIDFNEIYNKKNVFEFAVDEQLGVNIVDKNVEKFTVTVDMSEMETTTLKQTPGKVVFINQDDNYTYNIDYEMSSLDSIQIVGPKESIEKISAEDLQIEINVSSMNLTRISNQIVEVSNISIQGEEFSDCWVYGKYKVAITIVQK